MTRPTTTVAEVMSGPACHHAEGPLWDDRIQRLLWIDQYAGLVHVARHVPAVTALELEQTIELGCAVGAIAPLAAPQPGWVAACGDGFAHVTDGGERVMLATPEQGLAGANRMNDGKCDPFGRFWAGSMARDKTPGAGTLYRLDRELTVDEILTDVTISNGLAWSADQRSMYYIDTPTGRVDRFDVDAHGEIADRRAIAVIAASDGAPDGMCIDDEGCLWAALWGGSAVRRLSPAGEILAAVSVDAPQVSSCCFGAADRRTLFITTSQEDMGPRERDVHPLSGRVFCATLDVGGPPADRFDWTPS